MVYRHEKANPPMEKLMPVHAPVAAAVFCGLLLTVATPCMSQDSPTMALLLDDKEAENLKSPIKFSGLTLGYVNARLVVENRQPLYCTPPDFPNWSDDFFPLLQDWVRNKPYIQADKISSYPRHLIDALVDKYPCKRP